LADTVTQVVTISDLVPSLSVAGTFTICKGELRTYTVSGANSYVWSNSAQTQTVALSPSQTSTYYVTGSSGSLACQATKVFTVTVTSCIGVDEQSGIGRIRIFPNPVSGELNVESETAINLNVYSQKGELLMQKELQAGNNLLNTSTLSPGIYTLKLFNDKGLDISRLVKLD
jgi:hypothetical protein